MIKRINSFLLVIIFLITLTGCHEHKYESFIVQPTCEEQGHTIHVCECGESYLTDFTDELGHQYGDWEETKKPTQEEEGEKERQCIICNDVETETISKLPHTHKYEKTVIAPTCTTEGYTLYKCSCDDYYTNNQKQKLPHSYTEWTIIKEATETTEGLKERQCSMCKTIETETINVLEKQEVNVTFDLNGGYLENEITLENSPIAKKIPLTKYLSFDANGYQASISNSTPAIYWYYIVLKQSNVEGYYEIQEIVYMNSNITVNYDLVIMWHSSLKDTYAKTNLMDMYNNSDMYKGRLIKLDNVPTESGDCDITVNVLGYKEGSNIINDVYKYQTSLPEALKEDCKFLGWECSLDNKIYTEFPGYYENPGNIVYTAKFELNEISIDKRLDGTYNEIVKKFNEIDSIYENITLVTKDDLRNTTISYESSNKQVLSNTGQYSKPYQDTKVQFAITVTYQNNTKEYTYEFNIKGYKKLENIASSYVYTNYNSLTNEFFDTMDIIYCAFVLIDVNGGFTGVNGEGGNINGTNNTYLGYMKNIVIPQAHKRGGWVIASIGGGGSAYDKAFEAICDDDQKIDTLVNNIIKLINDYGFDGVDIDWEVPDDGKDFTKLMEKLYKAVKANNKNHLVTAAIGGGKWQPPKYDLKNSKKYLDYINLMTYSMVNNTGYHHTALYKSSTFFDKENKVGHTLTSCSVDESVKIYKDNYGIEASQLIIGGAFYGVKQTRSSTSSDWKSSGTLSYTTIKQSYMNNSNYDCFYDTNCQAAYILSKDKLTFISYDSIESMKAKCEYIKNVGAAGIMYWQNGQDTTGDLVNAIKEGLNK